MSHLGDLPIAHDEVGVSTQDGLDEPGDFLARILVIGIGVDDDVGAETKGSVETGHEAVGEAAPSPEPYDVVGAVLTGHGRRAIGRSIVHDENLHHVDSGDLTGDGREGRGQRAFLVQGRDLDDELHRPER